MQWPVKPADELKESFWFHCNAPVVMLAPGVPESSGDAGATL